MIVVQICLNFEFNGVNLLSSDRCPDVGQTIILASTKKKKKKCFIDYMHCFDLITNFIQTKIMQSDHRKAD